MTYDALDICGTSVFVDPLDVRSRSIATEIECLSPKFRKSVNRHLACMLASTQHNEEFRYVELSVGFIAKGADVAFETSRRAWHWLKDRIGFLSVRIDLARRLGFKIRRLTKGNLWGQHLVLHGVSQRLLDCVSALLSIAPATRLRQWKEVVPKKVGRSLMCSCPFHNDKRPSMIMNLNSDLITGSAVCFACKGANGNRLTAFWVKRGDKFLMSLSNNSKARNNVLQDQYNIKTSKTRAGDEACIKQNVTQAQRCDLTAFVSSTARVSTHNTLNRKARSSKSKAVLFEIGADKSRKKVLTKSLISSIRNYEHKSLNDNAFSNAYTELSINACIKDKFITVDDMVPREYREMSNSERTWYVPVSWKADTSSFVLIDLDKFNDAPVSHVAGKLLDKLANDHEFLDSGCLVIRTSHLGIQVLFRLKESVSASENWMATSWGKQFIDQLDSNVLSVFRNCGFVGGKADKMVHTVGRTMRLPGYRLDKQGTVYRSHIEYDSI